jgi:hypothetical protein
LSETAPVSQGTAFVIHGLVGLLGESGDGAQGDGHRTALQAESVVIAQASGGPENHGNERPFGPFEEVFHSDDAAGIVQVSGGRMQSERLFGSASCRALFPVH